MKLISIFSFAVFLFTSHVMAQDVAALNEKNISLTYDQAIAAYQSMADNKKAKLVTEGLTDCGRPLHLFIISADGIFNAEDAHKQNKTVVLINNGIHPGEPDGIDASVRLSQDYMSGKKKIPANVVILIIPVYNIDGSLRRGCCSRANQNGPAEYGFRGNSRNLDLNRDLIKADAANTKSFIKIFREWDPDVFVDTHVSDGADYQYTMTLINTQYNKLGGPAGEFLKNKMVPELFLRMEKQGNEMVPYVNTSKYDDQPEKGIYGFLEQPRFASGYAALFHCLAFVSETHMLKPFPSRVKATYALLDNIVNYSSEHTAEIRSVRNRSKELTKTKTDFPLNWESDTTVFEKINFKGFEAEHRESAVTGLQQLYFNEQKPFTRPVNFYDTYRATSSVKKPAFYIIPQAWSQVIERLAMNGVVMSQLKADSLMDVETYLIQEYKTAKDPYEGHYLHNTTTVKSENRKVMFHKGDYLVEVNQECNRYIVETLEPTAPDSWFNWGFFDATLQQKEWFSAYVFDGVAEKLLASDPVLKKDFELKKTEDKEFAADSFAQLYFIYKRSPWYEDAKRYPVARINR